MTKLDWFDIAARQLVEHGEAGLTLAALTRAARVTQGSYYHHFGGQSGFVREFLEHLKDRAFGHLRALEAVDASTPQAARRALRGIVEAVAGEDLALEAAVRRWAHSNSHVARVIHELDEARATLIYSLFLTATGSAERAAYLARLNGAFYLGAVQSTPPIQGAEYARMASDLERLLDAPEARR